MASQRSISPAVVPHFFKFVQPQIVQDGRLRIPKKFVANYAKDLSDRIYLKVPNGEQWLVNSRISNGEIWLQDGWKEFAEHYSIGLWHFLVFRYEGNSHFHVLIFDMSASEIEYPSPKTIHRERTDLNGESQLKRKGIIDDDNVKSKKTRSNSTFKEQILKGSGRDGLNSTQVCRMKQVKSEEELHSFDFVKEVGAECKQMASDAEKERALQSAKAFRSENPFFMRTMQPSYFICHQLTVQQSFMDRYFNTKNKVVNVTLGVSDGRTWPVNYTRSMRKLSKGWRTFASGNHLGVGDVCIFELIKGFTNFLNVVIFRARKEANC